MGQFFDVPHWLDGFMPLTFLLNVAFYFIGIYGVHYLWHNRQRGSSPSKERIR